MRRLSIFWLPVILLVIHSIDEVVTGFPQWATEHFGTTTVPFFIYTHIPILLIMIVTSYFAARNKGGAVWRVLSAVWIVMFAVNGLFHLLTSIVFREFTPGIISALVILFPLCYIFVRELLSKKLISEKQFRLALLGGVAAYLLGVASLWFDGNSGWGLF